MQKINKRKGILFWITGLSGSGKTSIAKKIIQDINKKYGPTLEVSGDDLRELFSYNKYSRKQRFIYATSYSKFCRQITNQNINIIFSTVSMFHKVRDWNRKNIDNYLEIYIKSDIEKLITKRKKFFYKGVHRNIVGKNQNAELPKKPHIILNNNFTISISKLSQILLKKIFKSKL
jgi:adenylylsulfate kinase-like enzyme